MSSLSPPPPGWSRTVDFLPTEADPKEEPSSSDTELPDTSSSNTTWYNPSYGEKGGERDEPHGRKGTMDEGSGFGEVLM